MPTRRQDSPTPRFEQSAYASSADFERGVLGNLVAARCERLGNREAAATLWWLQNISWRHGGLERFATDFLAAHRQLIGTAAMHRFGMNPGQNYDAAQVRTVRGQLLSLNGMGGALFQLKGEGDDDEITAQRHPCCYPAEAFRAQCEIAPSDLAKHLARMLVDPGLDFAAGLWNLPGLWPTLCALRDREASAAGAQIVATEITRQVADELDFAREARAFVLIEGREGIGKSEAARAWCERHPGQAVYVRLESGSDETTLYRAIARQIGTACSYGRKAVEMRARIQDALQAGQIMLVLDEAHFLWPQSDRSERAVPKRIDWLRTAIIDYDVPVALVSTPQFFAKQCDRFRKAGWNSLQVQRRLARVTTLPEELSTDDITLFSLKTGRIRALPFPRIRFETDSKKWKTYRRRYTAARQALFRTAFGGSSRMKAHETSATSPVS